MPGVTHEEPVAERFRARSRGLDACPDGGDVASEGSRQPTSSRFTTTRH
jgi:hypothetical protein